ncbi:uncharacterized protein TNCV_4842821 [Trichonephila clavipes]|uniref:Uncharacterized protein n=1 Tax=Trichonephila clavipes TaxID=2585209 RepID=A0A8X7BLT0_TRICX|nr:uncharacterized protein TNCV_4842821 [Trichonephila clavipes]
MPPNTLRVHTEYVLVKSVGLKSCGLSHERRDWRMFPSSSVQCRTCGGGDRPTTSVLLAPCHDEFRGPRSDFVRQVALTTTNVLLYDCLLYTFQQTSVGEARRKAIERQSGRATGHYPVEQESMREGTIRQGAKSS